MKHLNQFHHNKLTIIFFINQLYFEVNHKSLSERLSFLFHF